MQQREIDILPECQHQRVGRYGLEFAGGLRESLVVQLHLLDGQTAFIGVLDGGQPLDHDPFLQRLFHFEIMRGHFFAGAAIDDDGFGRTQAFGGARHIDGGVAAAIHHNAPPQHRLVFAFHAAQHRNGIDDPGGISRRNIGAFADVRADREESRVEFSGTHAVFDVRHFGVEFERDSKIKDALHFGIQHVARQPILGDAEAHHAARQRTRFVYLHAVSEPREMVCGGQSGRPGTDHQHALARTCSRLVELPAVLDCLVAEKAFDRIDSNDAIQLSAIACAFAGVVADAPHDGGKWIVCGQHTPGFFIVA